MAAIVIPVIAFLGYKWWTRTCPLEDGKKSFTFYYMIGCPHCKHMYPDITHLGHKYNNICIRWVEAKNNNELEVNSFPTLVYRNELGEIEVYKGERNAFAMRTFLDGKA